MMATTTTMTMTTTMMSTDGFMLGPLGLPERECESARRGPTQSPTNDWGEGNGEREHGEKKGKRKKRKEG